MQAQFYKIRFCRITGSMLVNLPEKLCPRTEQTSFQCNILVGSDCQNQLVVLAHRLDIPAFLLVAAVKRVRDLQNRSQLDDR